MAYTCPVCEQTSHHPKDELFRFCARCDRFEDDPQPGLSAKAQGHEITWLDSGREPQNPPDPAYPDGIDVVVRAVGVGPSCKVDLPYPAKRCGAYIVNCLACGNHTRVSTAGRPDDPRSVTVPCTPTAARAGAHA